MAPETHTKPVAASISISVAKAEESSRRFWEWCNTSGGLPEHYPDEEVVRFLMRYRNGPRRLLDLGCGSGKNAIAAAELGYDITGVDYSQPGLEYALARLKAKGLAGRMDHADFRNPPLVYADASFDLIVAIQIFDHLLDKQARALLTEAVRVLKPGGRMLATGMTTNTTRKSRTGPPLEGEVQTQLVSSGNSAGEIHRFFRPEQLEEFFKAAPLKILSVCTWTQRDDRTGETAEARYFTLEKSEQPHV